MIPVHLQQQNWNPYYHQTPLILPLDFRVKDLTTNSTSTGYSGTFSVIDGFRCFKVENSNWAGVINSKVANRANTPYYFTAWVYPITYSNTGINSTQIFANASGGSYYWGLGINASGQLNFYQYTGGQFNITSTATVTPNTWNYIGFRNIGTQVDLYLNNTWVASGNPGTYLHDTGYYNFTGFLGGFGTSGSYYIRDIIVTTKHHRILRPRDKNFKMPYIGAGV